MILWKYEVGLLFRSICRFSIPAGSGLPVSPMHHIVKHPMVNTMTLSVGSRILVSIVWSHTKVLLTFFSKTRYIRGSKPELTMSNPNQTSCVGRRLSGPGVIWVNSLPKLPLTEHIFNGWYERSYIRDIIKAKPGTRDCVATWRFKFQDISPSTVFSAIHWPRHGFHPKS